MIHDDMMHTVCRLRTLDLIVMTSLVTVYVILLFQNILRIKIRDFFGCWIELYTRQGLSWTERPEHVSMS